MAKSKIKSNKEYATESLSDVKGTIQSGGLYRIGSIHVLNVRLVTTEDIAAGNRLATLPFSIPGSAHVQFTCSNAVVDIYNDILRINTAVPNGTLLIISGVCVA